MAGSAGAAGSGDTGPAVVKPAQYDCTAPSTPERASPVAFDCILDADCDERLMSAHRGAGAPSPLAPENTLSAFRASIAMGADFSECDPRVTSDGQVVLMHDDTVDRTTSGTGSLDSMTLTEVQQLEILADGLTGDFSCDRVPTLEDVFDVTRGRIVLILDTSKAEADVELMVQTVRDANAVDWAIFDSNKTDATEQQAVIDRILAVEPNARFSIRASDEATLNSLLGVYGNDRPTFVHIGGTNPMDLAGPIATAGQRVFAIGFVRDITAEATMAFVPYEEFYGLGVDAIQSNRPDLLGEALGRSLRATQP